MGEAGKQDFFPVRRGPAVEQFNLPLAYDDLLLGDREWGEDLFLLEEEEDEELSSDCSSLTRHSTSPDR
jgi:hypothetical protein